MQQRDPPCNFPYSRLQGEERTLLSLIQVEQIALETMRDERLSEICVTHQSACLTSLVGSRIDVAAGTDDMNRSRSSCFRFSKKLLLCDQSTACMPHVQRGIQTRLHVVQAPYFLELEIDLSHRIHPALVSLFVVLSGVQKQTTHESHDTQ